MAQLGDYFCKIQYEPEGNMYCWFSQARIHRFWEEVEERKVTILIFIHTCKMLLLSPDSGIFWLGDFRNQGINGFIMRHTSFFKLKLVISGFRLYSHWMNTWKKEGKGGEGGGGEKEKRNGSVSWGDLSYQRETELVYACMFLYLPCNVYLYIFNAYIYTHLCD